MNRLSISEGAEPVSASLEECPEVFRPWRESVADAFIDTDDLILFEPAPVADERFSPGPENWLPGPVHLVLDRDARVRSGPPDFLETTGRIPYWTKVWLNEEQGKFARVTGADGTAYGWTRASNIGIFFKDLPYLPQTQLAPVTTLTIESGWSELRKALARTYNRLGGLLAYLVSETGIRQSALLAVWYVESGGLAHTVGRAVIRFENHLFFDRWGQSNEALYDRHFQHGGRAGVPGARWKNHRWRADPQGPFATFHGDQTAEYRVLAFATTLSDEATALSCISIGGPQILVANHRLCGYETPRAMYDAFQGGERAQVLGFFDYCQYKFGHRDRRGELLRDLAALRWEDFTRGYNGTGNVAQYSDKLRRAYSEAVKIIPVATKPPPPRDVYVLPEADALDTDSVPDAHLDIPLDLSESLTLTTPVFAELESRPYASEQSSSPATLPTVVAALNSGNAYFEFVRIFSKARTPSGGEAAGFFWILGEALMWQVPNSAEWKDWTEVYSWLPDEPHRGAMSDRKRLCRLPCTARQAQAAADSIQMRQADLLKATPDDMGSHFKPSSADSAPSLLPTPRLYDTLYLKADVRIRFQYVPGLERKVPPPLRAMSNDYNAKVNRAFDAAYKKSGMTRRPKSLGTPGKIWAIHEKMETWQWERDGKYWYVCAINHGFHKGEAKPTVEQDPGARHSLDHDDYSQILVAVAGWCLVMAPSDKNHRWMRTADVYQHPELCPLAVAEGKPLSRVKYTGTPRGPKPTRPPPTKS